MHDATTDPQRTRSRSRFAVAPPTRCPTGEPSCEGPQRGREPGERPAGSRPSASRALYADAAAELGVRLRVAPAARIELVRSSARIPTWNLGAAARQRSHGSRRACPIPDCMSVCIISRTPPTEDPVPLRRLAAPVPVVSSAGNTDGDPSS